MTGTGMVLGTPEYMAPELIMGEPFDGRVDQYALAITVYELLCGRRPFENETKTKILVLHTSKAPPALTELCPALPESLSHAVLKALSKEPGQRYPSCAALAAAVAATAAGSFAQEGRINLKCPRCGKTGSMAAADFSRLKKSGGQPACSVCKVALSQEGSAQRIRAPQTTLIEPSPASPRVAAPTTIETPGQRPKVEQGSAQRARAPQPTLIERTPAVPRAAAKTIIETPVQRPKAQEGSAPRVGAPQPALVEPRPAAQRTAPKTMIEAPGRRSTDTQQVAPPGAGRNPKSLTIKTPSRSSSAFQLPGTAHSDPVQKWITVGAGGGTAVLVLVLIALWLLPRNSTITNSDQPASEPRVVAKRKPASKPPHSPKTSETPSPTRVPGETEPVASTDTSTKKIAEPEPEPEPSRGPRLLKSEPSRSPQSPNARHPDLILRALPTRPKSSLRQPTGSWLPRPVTQKQHELDSLKTRLTRRSSSSGLTRNTALARLLKTRDEFADQLVMPTGMFHVAASPADNVNGQRKCLAIQRSMQSRPNRQNPLGLVSASSVELDVDPGLADRIDLLEAKTPPTTCRS